LFQKSCSVAEAEKKTFDKKSNHSKSSCLICLTFSGLMPVGMKNIRGNYHWKQPSTKKWLPVTQEVIPPS